MANNSLFIFQQDGVHAFMLIYVDDLILTGDNAQFLKKFVDALSLNFSLRNLGALNYFLGSELVPQTEGVILS